MEYLIGVPVGEYTLRAMLGQGAFAQVFEGIHRRTDERRAFKVARREIARGPHETVPEWSTVALVDMTGAIGRTKVDPEIVLRKQFDVLKLAGPPVFPQVDALVEVNGAAAIQMEVVEGRTLYDLLKGAVPEDLPLALAQVLARLGDCGSSHGDLKPSNIVWTGDRVVLVDPGFFGNLPSLAGFLEHVTITTPAYYPLRQPDDMMAYGLILVEIVTGQNPLRTRAELENGLVDRGLRERIERLHCGNNYFFDGISAFNPRTALGETLARSPLAPIIGQCLGLKLGSELSEGPKYPDFAAVVADLKKLAHPLLATNAPPAVWCFECGNPMAAGNRCGNCGARREAPDCPKCGRPVSRALNQAVPSYGFPAWTGIRDRQAWNAGWSERCAECNFEFAAKIQGKTGHSPLPGGPESGAASTLEIRGGESVHMVCDFWDHQPVVEVRVKRAVAANAGLRGLPEESSVRMTVEEWRIVLDKLQVELRPLLERRAWSRDTT